MERAGAVKEELEYRIPYFTGEDMPGKSLTERSVTLVLGTDKMINPLIFSGFCYFNIILIKYPLPLSAMDPKLGKKVVHMTGQVT